MRFVLHSSSTCFHLLFEVALELERQGEAIEETGLKIYLVGRNYLAAMPSVNLIVDYSIGS